MKHAILKSFAIGCTLLSVACGNDANSITDKISSAELALANENVSATREICSEILNGKTRSGIEAKQMAQLSILYMQLNERTDSPEDVELAVQCFREAFKINSDSAKAYYASLPYDQDKYAMTLSTIVHTLDNPHEIPAEHDCIPTDEDLHDMEYNHLDSID
ncbi:MAG: hypothetical protein NC411_05375 [Bacteroides sp.]|nr:hypothetical protein [Bacteroides sp.]